MWGFSVQVKNVHLINRLIIMPAIDIREFENREIYQGYIITSEDEYEAEFEVRYIGDDKYLFPLDGAFEDEPARVFIDGLVAFPESKSGEDVMYLVNVDEELDSVVFHLFTTNEISKNIPPSTQKQRIIVESNKSILTLRFIRKVKGFFIDTDDTLNWGYVIYEYVEWGSTYDKSPSLRPIMGETPLLKYTVGLKPENMCRDGGVLYFLSDNPSYIKEVVRLIQEGLVNISLKSEFIMRQIDGWGVPYKRWLAKKACRHIDVWLGGGRRG